VLVGLLVPLVVVVVVPGWEAPLEAGEQQLLARALSKLARAVPLVVVAAVPVRKVALVVMAVEAVEVSRQVAKVAQDL
jgi:hypothetical protein